MAAIAVMEVPLDEFVNKYRDSLPIVVQVRDGLYGSGRSEDRDTEVQDFSAGDYLQLLRVVEAVNVTFEAIYDQPSHQGQISLPLDHEGNIEVLSPYPDGHVFQTARDVLKDCVAYVYPQLQFEVQGEIVQPGDRLKIIKKVNLGGNFLLCMLVRKDKNIMIPLDTVGKFEKKGAFPQCHLKGILKHLPQRVRLVRDESMILRGIGHGVKGLPDDYDGELYLSKVEFVEAYLWNSPGDPVRIPCSTDINVIPADDYESQFGHVCDIHAFMVQQCFGDTCDFKVHVVITDDDGKADMLGIVIDSILQIRGQRLLKGVLAKGDKDSFLLPANFKGLFKFIPHEYQTAVDLNESDYKEEVRVTHAHNSTDPRDDSLYVNDKVKLHCKQLLIVERIPGTPHEEHELVLLDRTFSLLGHVGLVKVPTYAMGRFQTNVDVVEACSLDQVLSTRLPQTVKYVDSRDVVGFPLMDGERITLYGAHAFNAVYVIPDDAPNIDPEYIRVIQDFIPLQIRPKRPDLPGTETITKRSTEHVFQPPDMRVIKLRDDDFKKVFDSMEANENTYVQAGPRPQPYTLRQLPPPPQDEGEYDKIRETPRSQSVPSERSPEPFQNCQTPSRHRSSEKYPGRYASIGSPTGMSSAMPFDSSLEQVPEGSSLSPVAQKKKSPLSRIRQSFGWSRAEKNKKERKKPSQ